MSLPDKLWLRRGEVIAGLGITAEVFAKWVEAGVVTPKYFPGQSRAFFEREAVSRIRPEARTTEEGKNGKREDTLKGGLQTRKGRNTRNKNL